MTSKVLVVEDDQGLIGELEQALKGEGYDVVIAHDGVEALRAMQAEGPDLVILDPELAWLGGARVRQRLRVDAATPGEPFIVMSPRTEQQERVLPVPAAHGRSRAVDTRGLLTRMRALQQRATSTRAAVPLLAGALELDLDRWTVRVDGTAVALTPKEFGLLRMLMSAKGRVLTRSVLWEVVWEHGRELQFGSRAVDVHIGRLRHKLGRVGAYIVTVRDVGYRFVAPDGT